VPNSAKNTGIASSGPESIRLQNPLDEIWPLIAFIAQPKDPGEFV
jgi:hypothetical protein